MGGGGRVERGWEGRGGNSGWSLPPYPPLPIHWGRNILDGQGRPPSLAEGQLRFPLERWEIVASLGKKEGSMWGGFVHYCLCTGHGPSLLLGRAEYINNNKTGTERKATTTMGRKH